MRLLVINPNTSRGATDRIRVAANAASQPGDVFTTLCPAEGPELIVTQADDARAAKGVVEVVRTYTGPYDGIVLASFGDTGAQDVRALRPDLPVIGIASAAFGTVKALGGPFGIVTFGAGLVPSLLAKVAEAGLKETLVGILHVDGSEIGDPGTVQDRFGAELSDLCLQMQRQGARSIVMGGGPLSGLASQIAPDLPVPVIDGTTAAINMMRAVIAPQKSRAPRQMPASDRRAASGSV